MRQYCVQVIPAAALNSVEEIAPGQLKVKLTSPPCKGKGNLLLVEVLAKHWNVPKRKIRIRSGERSRQKRVVLED